MEKGVITRNITAKAQVWSFKGDDKRFVDVFINVSQHTHGSTKPRSGPINVKIKPYSGYTALLGHKETTGKNMAVQCYMVAKVLV